MSDDDREHSYAAAIVETITQPLLVLDGDLRVDTANAAFHQQFQVTRDATVGHLVCWRAKKST